ncbi:hypothetical protein DICVIV_11210 [Dictyocaulus viviparus]|uniref:Uncharacterized protein n=1 Tax=Dictyocaulus viviparus TaxID=29172 RepID=A0A0D8XDU0_DICVI|nr:hypothetical protein DICVIV_11210 [Dictyocaulus viviparus]
MVGDCVINFMSNKSFVRQFRSSLSSYSSEKLRYYNSSCSLPFQDERTETSVFAALHARKRKLDGSAPSGVVVQDKYVDIAENIRDFMRNSGGRAFTETITNKFKAIPLVEKEIVSQLSRFFFVFPALEFSSYHQKLLPMQPQNQRHLGVGVEARRRRRRNYVFEVMKREARSEYFVIFHIS